LIGLLLPTKLYSVLGVRVSHGAEVRVMLRVALRVGARVKVRVAEFTPNK